MAVYAFSDLHGHLELYNKIKNYVKPEDKLYCLGDCGDRGPEPWETIKAVAQDRQITYLKGNHEDMLIKAAREALDPDAWYPEHQRLLIMNGGETTLSGLMESEQPFSWLAYLQSLPTTAYYINTSGQKILMCHAGASIWADEPNTIPDAHDLIWDRLHYFDNSGLLDSTIVVHGHTPIKHLAKDIGVQPTTGALKYADGKKYCIDAGTYRSGRSILLNLDTFESVDISL